MYNNLINLLKESIKDEKLMKKNIDEFNKTIFDSELNITPGSVEEVLNDLAIDLESFVEDEGKRAQSSSYFGYEKATTLINNALKKVEHLTF